MKHNILLVDDTRANVQFLEHILAGLGHNIMAAGSGDEALRLADQHDFSLILLDVRMPGLNGYEVARRLREQEASRRVPFIFVTSLADQESEVLDGYDAGCVDYLIKPIDPNIVRGKVRVFCELQEKEKRIEEQLRQIEAQNRQLEEQLRELRELDDARMESEMRYRSLVTLSPQAIVVQVNGELVFYNASAIQMLGSIDEISMHRRPFHTFIDEGDRERVQAWIDEIVRRGGRSEPLECALSSHSPDHGPRHVELHACCILYDDEVGVQMAIQDITDHKILEDRLRVLSQVDGLTGAWNRRCFDARLDAEWRRLSRSGGPLSLLMIDLDQFKSFNDLYGHLEGDACLRACAEGMKLACGRPDDLVARYGGEEFVVLLPDTDSAGASHIAENIVAAIRGLGIPHRGNGGHGVATISCGVATRHPTEALRPADLIGVADEALYQSKRRGGNGAAIGRAEKPAPS